MTARSRSGRSLLTSFVFASSLAAPLAVAAPSEADAGIVCRTSPVRARFLRSRTPRLYFLETRCFEPERRASAARELHTLCDLLLKAYGPNEGRERCRAAVEERLGEL